MNLEQGFNKGFVQKIKCCQNKDYLRLSRQRDFMSLEVIKENQGFVTSLGVYLGVMFFLLHAQSRMPFGSKLQQRR